LRQLSIRGTMRNTVEILTKLCETTEFQSNTIDTAWLDTLISKKLSPDRPDTIVAVICTALHVGNSQIDKMWSEYTNAMNRGHILNFRDIFKGAVPIELLSGDTRFQLLVSRSGPHSYVLEMNNSFIFVDMHQLSDGGRLVLLGDRSYVTYIKEEIDKYRWMVKLVYLKKK